MMIKRSAGWATMLFLMAGLAINGCAARQATSAPTPTPPDDHPALFSTAATCAACHQALTDSAGNAIGFNGLWQGSMHAGAGVDPYYLATVRSEIEQYPEMKETVEATCGACHLPMANRTAQARGEAPAMFDGGAVDADHALHDYFRDSVSCTVCHQIQPDNLGSAEGNSGNFVIDLETPAGQRDLFGPFAVDAAGAAMMQPLGYAVKQSDHLKQSEMCAVCHTLYTSPIDENGKQSDARFAEQVPYLEWKQSAFAETETCQSCHMPAVEGAAKISSVGATERSPVSRHTFTGGNTFMLGLIRQNAEALGSVSGQEALAAGLERTQTLLQEQTASLEVSARQEGGELRIEATVVNRTGHKLPTAFPSRRVWLHVVVQDAQGQVVFESGAWDASGRIAGNDNDADGSLFEPHYDLVTAPDQVQIYEPILGDLKGQATTGVIKAASYLKDNRLLPDGFDKAAAIPETAPAGEAALDVNFSGGQDLVTYQIPATAGETYTVRVELLYQSIGYRWMQNIVEEETSEAGRLKAMTEAAGLTPVTLASQTLEAKP